MSQLRPCILAAANEASVPSDTMHFDPEIAVRRVWHGVPVLGAGR